MVRATDKEGKRARWNTCGHGGARRLTVATRVEAFAQKRSAELLRNGSAVLGIVHDEALVRRQQG
jgi:hypothetical protein